MYRPILSSLLANVVVRSPVTWPFLQINAKCRDRSLVQRATPPYQSYPGDTNAWMSSEELQTTRNGTNSTFHRDSSPHGRFEDLKGSLTSASASVSWGENRIDLFSVDDDGHASHRFWDGSSWQPSQDKTEDLGGDFVGELAAASWGRDRLDIVGHGSEGNYLHKYWNQDSWSDWEDFGGNFSSNPSVISWGPDRLDIFGIDVNGSLLHQYWNGESYLSEWEVLGGPFVGTPVSSSMGLGRLDVWVVGKSDGDLYHTFWAPGYYHGWETLGGDFETAPQVVHWGPNRIDIVGKFAGKDQYVYKYWDGFQWNPSHDSWSSKGGKFTSEPSATSWGEQSFHIFGLDSNGDLKWQFWQQDAWYPAADEYYSLGNASNPYVEAEDVEELTARPREAFESRL